MDAADKPAGARYGGPKAFVSGQQASAKDAAYTLSPAERRPPRPHVPGRRGSGGPRADAHTADEPAQATARWRLAAVCSEPNRRAMRCSGDDSRQILFFFQISS